MRRSVARSQPLFARLDAALEDRDHIALQTFSMADIVYGATVHRWFELPIERDPAPNLERWYRNMLTRPGYSQHVAVELS